jgi:hypothetical protein
MFMTAIASLPDGAKVTDIELVGNRAKGTRGAAEISDAWFAPIRRLTFELVIALTA